MQPFPELPRLDHTVILDVDQQAAVLHKLKDGIQALGTLHHVLSQGPAVDAQLAHSALSVAEHKVAETGEVLGISTNSQAQIEARHARLREANLRIHELEAQIGDAAAPDAVGMALGSMEKRFDYWWRKQGFGLVTDLSFTRHGAAVDLSCTLFGDFVSSNSDTPETDKAKRKAWHAELQRAGFVLVKEDRNVCLVDCDASRDTLARMLQTALPSVRIKEYVNHVNRHGVAVLVSLKCSIYKLADFQKLPLPDKP